LNDWAIVQIAKTVQWFENIWKQSSKEGPDATDRLSGSWLVSLQKIEMKNEI